MTRRNPAAWLYLANATVLITHEIDSAYWHEWELFRLPGGVQLFLILHIFLIGVVLWGYRSVVLRHGAANIYSGLLASAGLVAVLVHGGFLAAGAPQFSSPISLTLLAATLVLSTWQFVELRRRGAEA